MKSQSIFYSNGQYRIQYNSDGAPRWKRITVTAARRWFDLVRSAETLTVTRARGYYTAKEK